MSDMKQWFVWLDWCNDDFLACEAGDMTDSLHNNLLKEKVALRKAIAPCRREAVRRAFPEHFEHEDAYEQPQQKTKRKPLFH